MVKVISFPSVLEVARKTERKAGLAAQGVREKLKPNEQKKSQRGRGAAEGRFRRSAFRERSRPNNVYPNKMARIGNKVTPLPRRELYAVIRRQSNYRVVTCSGCQTNYRAVTTI